jgi:hypothetical protein
MSIIITSSTKGNWKKLMKNPTLILNILIKIIFHEGTSKMSRLIIDLWFLGLISQKCLTALLNLITLGVAVEFKRDLGEIWTPMRHSG